MRYAFAPLLALVALTSAAAQPAPLDSEQVRGLRLRPGRPAYTRGEYAAFVLTYRPADPAAAPRSATFGNTCHWRLERRGDGEWEAAPRGGWAPPPPPGVRFACTDEGYGLEAGGAWREGFRLHVRARPGTYRWCLDIVTHDDAGRYRLSPVCSEEFEVRARSSN